ncbi:MAG: hypothetical protein AABY64_10700 [Bdellovibrionota bacterium]
MRSTTIVFFLIYLSCISSYGWDATSPNEYIKSKIKSSQLLQEKALSLILTQRCDTYFNEVESNSKSTRACQQTVQSFLRQMPLKVVSLQDPSSLETGATTIIYPSELRLLIRQTQIAQFLSALSNQLDLIPAVNLDLYSLALQISKSEIRASQWMAVLFQDVSPGQAHVTWLKSLQKKYPEKFNEVSNYNIDLLDKVLQKLRLLLSTTALDKTPHRFYPPTLDGQLKFLNSSIYHYYVIKYTALTMVREGLPSDKVFFVNFIFNYLYEVFDQGPAHLFFTEAKQLPQESWSDVWMGLLGALDGSSKNSADIVSNLDPQKLFQMTPEQMIIEITKTVSLAEQATRKLQKTNRY